MTTERNSRWYVVQTHVNAETKAADNLKRQGFAVYLPCYLKHRSHARKMDIVARPLFPRYLFVSIDVATQRWRAIQSTLGVSYLVCWSGKPAWVEDSAVSGLKAREDESGFVKFDQRPKFALGQKVRVLAGAFAENLGLFDGLADRDRIAILLDLLGRKVRVSLEAEMVAAA